MTFSEKFNYKETAIREPKRTKKLPEFPLSVRNEILTYTDDKTNHAMINAVDADTEVVILAGGKGCGKSFAFPCIAIYNMLQDPDYNCVMCRNLKIDIKNTIRATLEQFLIFLKIKYKIDLLRAFKVYADEIVLNATKQRIYFENFQKPGAFAGFALSSPTGYIGDVFLDEIMQKRSNLATVFQNDEEIKKFYNKQKEDMELLKAATIYRTKNTTGRRRHIYMSMNLWEPDHWVIHDYFDPIMPIGPQNYHELEEKRFIFKQNKNVDCTILRLSTLYVPSQTISEAARHNIEKLKRDNYALYVASVLGDAYIEHAKEVDCFLRDCIYAGKSNRMKSELFIEPGELYLDEIVTIVDGYDPGAKDQNGLVRIALLKNGCIVVINAQAFNVNKKSKFRRREMCRFVLQYIQRQNAILPFDHSLLAVDSKEDVLMEMLGENIVKQGLNISLIKAIKNKNKFFKIDFNIRNRMIFVKYLFKKKLIKVFPTARILLEYLAQIVIDEEGDRDERINPKIYDIVNAFEYALSVVYKNVLIFNGVKQNEFSTI